MSATLSERYQAIVARCQAACKKSSRDPRAVCLIAVSKTKSFEDIQALYELGHRDFGENYVQELLTKIEAAKKAGLHQIRWHMIGHLQTNKVKQLLSEQIIIHTLDSLKLAQEVDKRATRTVTAFIEINIDNQPTKAGIDPQTLPAFCAELSKMKNIHIAGLMCIPDPQMSDDAFRRMKDLEKQIATFTQGSLSMGMSDDFEAAILAGATHVRVGSAIFGARV